MESVSSSQCARMRLPPHEEHNARSPATSARQSRQSALIRKIVPSQIRSREHPESFRPCPRIVRLRRAPHNPALPCRVRLRAMILRSLMRVWLMDYSLGCGHPFPPRQSLGIRGEMITLYELVGAEGRSFSPNVWRTRMALAHKNLPYEAVPLRYSDIASILDGKQKTVPVISDSGRIVADSWAIANYLEDNYTRLPSLFGGTAGRDLTLFVQSWTADSLHRGVIDLVLFDVFSQLHESDKAYFRSPRE